MILSYHNLGEEKRHTVRARITTEHAALSYSRPAIVLENGGVLDRLSWTALEYQVVRAGKKEKAILAKMRLL